MKLRFFSLVLIGLLTTITFGATIAQWIQDPCEWKQSGNWTEAWCWKSTYYTGRPPGIGTGGTGDEIKLNGNFNSAGQTRRVETTIDTDLLNYNCKLTIAGGNSPDVKMHRLFIKSGAVVDMGQFQVGHGNSSNAGLCGRVEQTGGVVSAEKLMIGIHGSRGKGVGQYMISGGTLQSNSGLTTNTGRLMVGTGTTTGSTTASSEGTLTIVGAAATISMKDLYVGGYSTYVGTGTIEYKIMSDGVSQITVSNGITLPAAGVANLNVIMVQSYLGEDIVLVENTGTSAVSGMFDLINGVAAGEGAVIVLGASADYTLTYQYDASTGAHTGGNDIALIPEPATIALLSLGLIAIRRKK